jgi:hypothetical protein
MVVEPAAILSRPVIAACLPAACVLLADCSCATLCVQMAHLVGRQLVVPPSEAPASWGSPPEEEGWPASVKRYLSAAREKDKRWEILCDIDQDVRGNRIEYGFDFLRDNLVLNVGESKGDIVSDRRSKAGRRSGQTGTTAQVQARAGRSAAAASAGQVAMMVESEVAGASTNATRKRGRAATDKPMAASAAATAAAESGERTAVHCSAQCTVLFFRFVFSDFPCGLPRQTHD